LRIGFVITELLGGGAERSMLSIIEALDRSRFDPILVLFDRRIDHAPPDGVDIVVLERRGAGAIGRLVSRIRQLVRIARARELDLLVSFLIAPNVVAIAAGRLAGVPVVAGERSAPRHVLAKSNQALSSHRLWAMLVRLTYPRAAAIVTNTAGARTELIERLGVAPQRIAVIANPIDLDRIRTLSTEPAPELERLTGAPLLVHVARFSYAKDHETLLRAFALVRSRRSAHLVLVGDGEDEARVRALSTGLGLDTAVTFVGFTRNPYKYLARAAVSVLTSRFEGLPNGLLESMALGVPIVSTACEYGPIELLRGTGCGVLAPVGDAPAIASAIESVLDDPALRAELVAAGRQRVTAFDRRQVAAEYADLFTRAARSAAGQVKSSRATSTSG
jgi:glycosyltransferase involved in cell wall biosynthesis